MKQRNLREINTTALAYIGDAVYEIYVREHVLDNTLGAYVDKLHRGAIKYVCADGQAKVVKALLQKGLTVEEESIVRRARNHKISSKPKNVDPGTYKYATAFEALIGYLYLKSKTEPEAKERMEELIEKAFEIIEGDENE